MAGLAEGAEDRVQARPSTEGKGEEHGAEFPAPFNLDGAEGGDDTPPWAVLGAHGLAEGRALVSLATDALSAFEQEHASCFRRGPIGQGECPPLHAAGIEKGDPSPRVSGEIQRLRLAIRPKDFSGCGAWASRRMQQSSEILQRFLVGAVWNGRRGHVGRSGWRGSRKTED